MKRFSLTTALLLLTWSGIGAYVASRYLKRPPYGLRVHEIDHTAFSRLDDDVSRYGPQNIEDTLSFERSLLEKCPPWDSSARNPPLSAHAALSIANAFALERLEDNSNWLWGLDQLALCPVDSETNTWCWRIDFFASHKSVASAAGTSGSWSVCDLSIFVMMDGTAVLHDLDEQRLVASSVIKPAAKAEKR